MFSTLDASSFSVLNNSNVAKAGKNENDKQLGQKQIPIKTIVCGAKARSKTGCVCCRRRK